MNFVLSLAIAYFLGSIPFAYLIGRLKGIDIRKMGDRNVGSFNVFRHVGLNAGIVTLVADIGKGALAVIVAKSLSGDELLVFFAGVAAVVGHIWPVFLHFQGGRGVGTIIGIMLVLLPREISITMCFTIVLLFVTRSSLWSGVSLFIPLPLLAFLCGETLSLIVYSMALPCMSGLAHWLTTRHLSPESKKEAGMIWIAPKVNRKQ